MGSVQDVQQPCPTCGGRAYSWGRVVAQGMNFTPEDTSLLGKFFRIGTGLAARRCDDCGNLQLFARPPEGEG